MDYATKIEEAVKQFYAKGDDEVHKWLLQVQASPEAWTFVWQFLNPSNSWEVQFFAATTLHTKISEQWNEVPRNEYPALQDHLVECIKQANMPKFVLAKLCQALAGFLANRSAVDDHEKNRSLVDELLEMLPCNTPPAMELLLQVLLVIPVEMERTHKAKQERIHEGLVKSWCKATWLLQQVFTTCSPNSEGSDSTLYLLAIECVLSWVKVTQLPVETNDQIYPYLLVAAAHYAPNREGSDNEDSTAWEIVHECITKILTSYELYRRPQTLWQWAHSLISMAQQYRNKYFCEILTDFGETQSRAFLIALAGEGDEAQKATSEGLVELLLECSEQKGRYPTDETRSSIPFGFWYALQDNLGTLDQPLENKALLALKPIYARLAQALLRKSTLPSCPNEEGDTDEREVFRCYRQDVADTLDYCYRVLGGDLLLILGQRLRHQLDNWEKWTEVESTLHAFKTLAGSVGTEESHYILPALMDMVLSNIPYDFYPEEVLACACSTMGAYAEWIDQHPDPWLERVLGVVTLCLTRGVVTVSASMALKDLARECSRHIGPFAPAILKAIGQTLPHVAPADAGSRLMYTAGKLLSTMESTEEQLVHLDATLGLCIMKIRQLLARPFFVSRDGVIHELQMATMFLYTLEGAIGKTVLEGLLPVFSQIVAHPEWSQDNDTLDAMYSCAQRALTSLSHPEVDARPLLPILTKSYKVWPHPTALHLLRQLILLFGKDPENVVTPVFAELSSVTLSGIKACRSVRGDLSYWSDLMEAYLELLAQICKKNSRLLMRTSDQIPEMLECGMACLALPVPGTTKAAGSFLTHAIEQIEDKTTFIFPIGEELVYIILQCIGGRITRNNLDPQAEVLLALNKKCRQRIALWFDAAWEKQKGELSTTQAHKEAFKRNVLREVCNKSRMTDIVKQFSLQCRQQMVEH